MLVLIDADSLCYANAFAVQKDGELIVGAENFMYTKLRKSIDSIIHETDADDFKVFLTGASNFREEPTSLYKANRASMKKPMLLPEARHYLFLNYDAVVVEDMEADDAVCIEQTRCMELEIDSVIAHIDKDIDQQEGLHYRWAIGKQPSRLYYVDEIDGLRNLYTQALTGDKVDNIMYYLDETTGTWKKDYGLGKVGATNAMLDCETEQEMYDVCVALYRSWTRKSNSKPVTRRDLHRNMKMLYMLRHEEDYWRRPR